MLSFWKRKIMTSAVLMLPMLFACRQGPSVDLRQTGDVLWFYHSQKPVRESPQPSHAWQTLAAESFDEKPANPDARMWLSYALPDNPRMNYLILSKCSNVSRIFQDQNLIHQQSPEITYPRAVSILQGEPFLVLADAKRPSRLTLETFYSDKSGYRPTCHDMSMNDREMAVHNFMSKEFQRLVAGTLFLFMGIASFLLFAARRARLLLYFSLTAITIGATYLMGSHIALVLFTYKPSWQATWHLLLAISPIPFFLFINSIRATPNKIAVRLAQGHALIFCAILGFWFFDADLNFDSLRRNFYKIMTVELAIFLPFSIGALFERSPYAMRIGLSLLALNLAALHDVGSLLFSTAGPIMFFPWILIGFICVLLSIMIEKTLESEALLQRAKAKIIAERNHRLQMEVDRRTADLNRRNSELEKIHLELEDHHEILGNQKDKVSAIAQDKDVILSRIADLRNQSISRIFACLQQLHRTWDDDAYSDLKGQINLLMRTLDPAARHYEKSPTISKKRLLILDADRKHQRIYRMAIGGSKVDMQLAENPIDFMQLIEAQSFDLLALHQSWLGMTEEILKASSHSRIVVLSSDDTVKNLALLRQHPAVTHVMPLHLPRSVLQQMLLIHLSKLLSSDIFGIEKYLAWGFEIKERPLPALEQRDFLVRQLREDLEKMGFECERIDAMAEITSCLLSIKKGHALVSDWSSHAIGAPLQQLRFGFDACLVALSMDLRGTLLTQTDLIQFLERHIQASEASRSMPSLSRLLQLADALIINSDGDRRHELIVLIYLEKNPQSHQPAAYFYFESR